MKTLRSHTLLVLAFSAGLSSHAAGAVFQCAAGDVACLISAINTANGTADPDTIQLAPGTYTLTGPDNAADAPTGLPVITSDITIVGAGAGVTTIQRDPALVGPTVNPFRILHVAASGTLHVQAMTISNGALDGSTCCGNGGAGIFNEGTTTLAAAAISKNVVVLTNGGGGIRNFGTLAVSGSRFEDNVADVTSGGAISSKGTLTVTQSTFRGNTAEFGVAILNSGPATISDTAIIGNQAEVSCAGILNADSGQLSLSNSTIAGNDGFTRGGGLCVNSGTVQLEGVTIADNNGLPGGGIFTAGGTTELRNTILARNTSPLGPDCSGTLTSLGHNLIGDTTGCTITLATGDLTGDPGLGTLQDDDSPGNAHIPLVAGSQAIDAGDTTACSPTDQIGHPRVGACDIGAVEFFVDSDGDGVPDATDECPTSNLAATVVIGTCDSGVPNTLFSTGCSVADLLLQCAVGATNRGQFVSCVSHVTNDLKKQGVISGFEKGAIQTCAAEAPIP